MPVTRRSAAAPRPSSLLGHFQATKRSSSSASTPSGVKGKGKAVQPVGGVTRVQDIDDSSDRFATPEPRSASQPTQPPHDVLADSTPRPSTSSSSSPPPEMLEAEHKSPLSVRQDPDKNKLYLLISPGAQARARRNREGLSISAPPLPYLRQGSPSTDRTPIRETPPGPLEPPQAPRKRRLSQLSYERIQAQSEDSPLPLDRKRPSYKALGASQEGGLSLMDMAMTSGDESRAQTPTRTTSAGDGDLVITPRSVREQPTGHPLTSFATPTKAAKFVDPFGTPRPKPTISAGIFSTLASSPPKAGPSKRPRVDDVVFEDENPFIDQSHPAAAPVEATSSAEGGIASLPYRLSADLPLPGHYNSLYLLHTAIERALVVHLATAGLGSSSTSTSSTEASSAGPSTTSCIRLPNIISYSALQPLVERAAGRKLGPVELSRLVYIWSNGRIASIPQPQRNVAPTAPAEQLPKDGLGGLGFVVTRQRSLDSSGRRRWDWSLGIELTVSRTRRQVTPPMQVSYGVGDSAVQMPATPPSKSSSNGVFGIDTPPSTPPSSKRKRETSSGSATSSPSVGREGMSFVAMWNNGIEERKNEVSKRLRTLCAQGMEDWLGKEESGQEGLGLGISARGERATTPEAQTGPRPVEVGPGGLVTPSSTRPEGRKAGSRTVHFSEEELDGKLADAKPSQTWQRPSAGGELSSWHPDWNLKDAPAIPCALLPSLREAAPAEVRITKQPRLSTPSAPAAAAAATSTVPTTSLSLVERIRAKEEAKRLASASQRHFTSLPGSEQGMMSSFKRRSTLSRLNDVASNLYLLFTTSPSSSSSSSTPTSSRTLNRFPVLPLPDVLASISKSSKVALSASEARAALELLREVCPGFVELRNVGGKEWAKLEGKGEVGLAEVRRRVREELEMAR